ncbi:MULTISPECIES: C40 family peptidase [unclassified Capnocytophaga]|jgi:Cell wall-associated hydrolases (invasion-associated proteins)|uniref:C40 family peptidase n=1 Tax=unclassified Capnocytophaga TaxID=2640652 RepID=UPI000202F4BB|nr:MULTISPECIES: C40 family peptidase [unclassified Capnocytophaga]EGD34764.1 lipoprotein NlpC [Capnocytophaga sp. oral taxon 338 str. F0234]MEB3005146.1 C40 family peptidase [Capnocytophaga sp. G2]
MKKIFLLISIFFFAAGIGRQAEVKSQNRPDRPLVDNPSYMEGGKDEVLIAATDFGNISRYEKRVIDEVGEQKGFRSSGYAKPNMDAFSGEERIVTLIDSAYSYIGTPYKAAGATRSGMDCSGFVSTAFGAIDINLSRSSTEMATQGKDIPLNQATVGDLLFFKTTRKRNRISHVGIIVEAGDDIKFIHASTSQGVMVSSLSEPYWQRAYTKASRVLK